MCHCGAYLQFLFGTLCVVLSVMQCWYGRDVQYDTGLHEGSHPKILSCIAKKSPADVLVNHLDTFTRHFSLFTPKVLTKKQVGFGGLRTTAFIIKNRWQLITTGALLTICHDTSCFCYKTEVALPAWNYSVNPFIVGIGVEPACVVLAVCMFIPGAPLGVTFRTGLFCLIPKTVFSLFPPPLGHSHPMDMPGRGLYDERDSGIARSGKLMRIQEKPGLTYTGAIQSYSWALNRVYIYSYPDQPRSTKKSWKTIYTVDIFHLKKT